MISIYMSQLSSRLCIYVDNERASLLGTHDESVEDTSCSSYTCANALMSLLWVVWDR